MKLNKYILMVGLAASAAALTTACDDQGDEITSADYSRLFSPIHLEARVVNQVNVRLNWYEVKGADSYTINVYLSSSQTGDVDENETTNDISVSGTPVQTLSGINYADVPYVVTGLDGDTKYTFVISAQGSDIAESKGTAIQAKTGIEQIMYAVADADIEATSVTLRWTPGTAEGCSIVLTPGDIKHTITATEAAEGAAVITGLTGETQYTAKIMNGNKQRGTTTFKTAVDLGDAIAVNPGDDLNTIIENAEEGATLALFPGTYECLSEDGTQVKVKISKSISIKAVRPAERPVIKGCIHLENGASLTMSQVILDGTGSDGSQAFEWKTATAYENLVLDDCEVKNYTKGFFYLNVAAVINSITINNCLIHDIECSGGDMFDSRKGGYNEFNLTNTTIYRSAAKRDVFRYDDASSAVSATSKITVDHCTFAEVGNGNANYRFFYVRFKGNSITFTNNIVADFINPRGFSEQAGTAVPTFEKNYYYKTLNLLSLADGNTQPVKFFDAKGTNLAKSPFKDAANADYTIVDEDVAYANVGDPRWIK